MLIKINLYLDLIFLIVDLIHLLLFPYLKISNLEIEMLAILGTGSYIRFNEFGILAPKKDKDKDRNKGKSKENGKENSKNEDYYNEEVLNNENEEYNQNNDNNQFETPQGNDNNENKVNEILETA